MKNVLKELEGLSTLVWIQPVNIAGDWYYVRDIQDDVVKLELPHSSNKFIYMSIDKIILVKP